MVGFASVFRGGGGGDVAGEAGFLEFGEEGLGFEVTFDGEGFGDAEGHGKARAVSHFRAAACCAEVGEGCANLAGGGAAQLGVDPGGAEIFLAPLRPTTGGVSRRRPDTRRGDRVVECA